jgi:hypothetical protein
MEKILIRMEKIRIRDEHPGSVTLLCPLIKRMFWYLQVIEPQFQRDFISLLPKELALYVLAFLHPKDLLR